MIRDLDVSAVREKVAELCGRACIFLPADVRSALEQALALEESPVGRQILKQIIANADLAAKENMAICQDCGLAVIFLDIGQDLHFSGGDLYTAIHQGVAQGYRDYYLRKSTCDPLTRANRGDNTPAIIYSRIVPGDGLRMIVMPKGGGGDNMSRISLLTPAAGWPGIKKTVLDAVEQAGSNACPPLIVGVAVGGTFENAGVRAKRILARSLAETNSDPDIAAKEAELLEAVNNLGHGPSGLGGRTTCLRIFLDLAPSHIAGLPVAVNLQCHAARHEETVL